MLLRLVLLVLLAGGRVSGQLCEVGGASPVVVLDLPESAGNQTNQATTPPELPLGGEVGDEVDLTLSPEGKEHFRLEGKRLRLTHPLDRDAGDLSTLRFAVECRTVGPGAPVQRSVPVVVRIVDRNDNAPRFVGAPYVVTVPESTPVGTTVFKDLLATDADHGANGQIRYTVVPGDGGPTDGYGSLAIPLPHQPVVTVVASLDFEATRVLVVTVQASDSAGSNQQSTLTTLTVHIEDSDDQDPLLLPSPCYPPDPQKVAPSPCPPPPYTASVVAGVRAGVLDVLPERVHAVDLDSQGAPVRYSLVGGAPPSFRQFFALDPHTGALSQVAPVPRVLTDRFVLQVQAEEQTPRRGSAVAPLTVTVTAPDAAVPVLRASAAGGTVVENAAVGTPVVDDAGEPVTLTVSDPDLLPGETPPTYQFELTTGAFKVTPEGVLVVAAPGLDRDPPSTPTHSFQVVAREVERGGGRGVASPPLPLTVTLGDDNDNAPRFPLLPPVVIPAGTRPLALTTVGAVDEDAGPHGEVQYRLVGVAGGPTPLFQVDPTSGLVRLVGPVVAGDLFQLHIEATDGGGLTGATQLEVRVTRGPNTGGPYFPRRVVSAVVPEDTTPGAPVITVKATDPDGDVPRYSLHSVGTPDLPQRDAGSGEDPLPFQVDPLSGEVTLSGPLDREQRGSYQMVIRAQDDDGLQGSVTVDVTVADVNDVRPYFLEQPYSFRVMEGAAGGSVGVVKAGDDDEGKAGLVQYSVPPDSPIAVGVYNGSLSPTLPLDYETQQVHYVVVTASDGGRPPLSATATVTLLVGDVSDEPPVFPQVRQEVGVGEDAHLGELVATVEAVDPDSAPSVTYVMRGVVPSIGTSLFTVAADTGRVTVTGPLDRETVDRFELRIGTVENSGTGTGAECVVAVTVEDVNDHSPSLPPLPPILVPLHTPAGGELASVGAVDGDATSPNNLVEYELVGAPVVLDHVAIDPSTGVISLTRPFLDLNTTELRAEVVVRDGGQPPRTASAPLLLLVEVAGAPPPRVHLPPAFSRNTVGVTVREDARVGGILARVGVIHPPPHPRCALLEETEQYQAHLTTSGDCALHLIAPLDADGPRDGNTQLTLLLLNANETEPLNVTAKINVTVEDVNDNAPTFVTPTSQLTSRDDDAVIFQPPDTVLVTVSGDVDVGTIVMQVNATDPDSGPNGEVLYSLLPESNRGGFFGISATTGTVVTARPLRDVPPTLNPFNLTVVASDNPVNRRRNHVEMRVVVNVIGPTHRVVLPVWAPPQLLQERREALVQALGGREDADVVLEKVGARDNQTAPSTRGGEEEAPSEVWLALLDPNTGELLPTSHPRVNRVMSQPSDSVGSLRYAVLEAVGQDNLIQQPHPGTGVTRPRAPPPPRPPHDVFGGTSLSAGGPESIMAAVPGLQLGLVVLAVSILVLGLLSILYICVHWARAMRQREKITTLPVMRVPFLHPHPPPSSITDTLHKQYEVQVLHMSVPVDEDSLKDAPSPPRSTHHFVMDNVSYISKNPKDSDVDDVRFSPSTSNSNVVFGRRTAERTRDEEGRTAFNESDDGPTYGRDDEPTYGQDDDVVGYGFNGSGIARSAAPVLDLSPVQTTTLL